MRKAGLARNVFLAASVAGVTDAAERPWVAVGPHFTVISNAADAEELKTWIQSATAQKK